MACADGVELRFSVISKSSMMPLKKTNVVESAIDTLAASSPARTAISSARPSRSIDAAAKNVRFKRSRMSSGIAPGERKHHTADQNAGRTHRNGEPARGRRGTVSFDAE